MKRGEGDGRLYSLDVLRGFDMFFIMGGDALLLSLCWLLPTKWGSNVASQLGHPVWHGFTAYDLIFPLFLFISGISFPFSFEKQIRKGNSLRDIRLRIVKRGLILIFLGIIYNGLFSFDFENLRIASVLGRIGMAWMFAAMIATCLGRKLRYVIMVILLFGYWALLSLVGAPDSNAGNLTMEGNVVSYIDRVVLPGALHNKIHDPEGLLATIPAICTALLGIEVGEIVKKETWKSSCCRMLIWGVLLVLIGYIWGLYFPINKNLWTSSFVCLTGGISMLLFTIFYYLIDVCGCRKGTLFFRVIGINSITIYLAQQFIDFGFTTNVVFGGISNFFTPEWGRIILSLGYVLICWFFLWFLHKHRVYLKI